MLKNALSKVYKTVKEAQQKYPVESANAIEQVSTDIENLNAFINREVDKIEFDSNLDDEGKSSERRKVLEQAGRKLEGLKEKRMKSDLIYDLEKKLIDKSGAKSDSVIQFLREREVRDRLQGLTSEQILSHFGESLFNGKNRLLLDAILNAPAGFEILPKEPLQKLREVRAKVLNPEVAAQLDTIRKLNASMEKIFGVVQKEIDNKRRDELPEMLTPKVDFF
ncbi:MAG: hypothetical protein QNJ58_11050 [Desulfobacterales bacterium]|nr:hypothetical protein [Desulfobacterales bacterium]